MTEKRKHDGSPGTDQARTLPEDGSRSMSPQDAPTVVENYPRKRIAIAVGNNRDLLTQLHL